MISFTSILLTIRPHDLILAELIAWVWAGVLVYLGTGFCLLIAQLMTPQIWLGIDAAAKARNTSRPYAFLMFTVGTLILWGARVCFALSQPNQSGDPRDERDP